MTQIWTNPPPDDASWDSASPRFELFLGGCDSVLDKDFLSMSLRGESAKGLAVDCRGGPPLPKDGRTPKKLTEAERANWCAQGDTHMWRKASEAASP